jgi:hypothetical protein
MFYVKGREYHKDRPIAPYLCPHDLQKKGLLTPLKNCVNKIGDRTNG